MHRLFTKLQFSRIFPLGYIVSREDSKPRPEEGIQNRERLLFLGDSRAELWEFSSFGDRYIIKNIGHGGQTSAQVLLQLQSNSIPEFDWAIIQVGINDMHSLGALAEIKYKILSDLSLNTQNIVKKLCGENKKVIITTIIPPSKPPFYRLPFWDRGILDIIRQLNLELEHTVATEKNVFIIDSYQLFGDTKGWIKEKFESKDFFLHLNSLAYEILNKEIVSIIESNKQ